MTTQAQSRCSTHDAEVRFPAESPAPPTGSRSTARAAARANSISTWRRLRPTTTSPTRKRWAPLCPRQRWGLPGSARSEARRARATRAARGHSVWYSWTPSSSGPVALSACPYGDFGADTLLAVYTGSAVGALTPVAANDDAPAAELQGHRQPRSSSTPSGGHHLPDRRRRQERQRGQSSPSISGPARATTNSPTPRTCSGPSPDDRAALRPPSPPSRPGEPDHAGDPGGHSLWYSWTAVSQRSRRHHRLRLQRASVDTLLAVYTGSALGSLTPVASDDDAAPAAARVLRTAARQRGRASTPSPAPPTGSPSTARTARGSFVLALRVRPGQRRLRRRAAARPVVPVYGVAVHQAGRPSSPASPTTPATPAATRSGTRGHRASSGPVGALDLPLQRTTSMRCSRSTPAPAFGGLTPVASDDDDPPGGCRTSGSETEFNAVAGHHLPDRDRRQGG